MTDRSCRVALLIDYDNLQICASRDTPGRDLQLDPVVQLAQRYGTIMLARAYAEWNLSTERMAVYKAGIEPAFAPVLRTENDRSGKSLADTVMVAEGMDILWTLAPDVLVLATSDKDLIPLVRVAKQRGARVVVVGSDLTAIPLREMADEHVTYKQLVNEATARVAEFTPGRVPATLGEPVRRASGRADRDRPVRERDTERVERDRPDRVPRARVAARATPALEADATTGADLPSASPVAPAAVGAEGEGGLVGRRRRRRGGRRRGERGAEDGLEGGELSAQLADATRSPDADRVEEVTSPTVEDAIAANQAGSGERPVAYREALGEPREESSESLSPNGLGADARPSSFNLTPTPAADAGDATDDGTRPPEGAASVSEDAPPARRPRARRVASATRGRARPSAR